MGGPGSGRRPLQDRIAQIVPEGPVWKIVRVMPSGRVLQQPRERFGCWSEARAFTEREFPNDRVEMMAE